MLSDSDLQARLRGVLAGGWYALPDRGTGAPGLLLENLLGLDSGNRDSPDAGKWEIKFHGPQTRLLTLFHLEAAPRNHMHHMVRQFGHVDRHGRVSFRHTIHRGKSCLGFYVANESFRITVRHREVSDIAWPHWTHDRLINAFVSKLRRLVTVRGRKRRTNQGTSEVTYERALLYWEPKTTSFPNMIANGTIAIDFDARTSNGQGLRNHGTKFRIALEDLPSLYHHEQVLA